MEAIEKFKSFPPQADQTRLKAYESYQDLFLGQHGAVFKPQPKAFEKLVYIVANFPRLISTLCADLLFGEDIDILALSGNEKVQKALNRLRGEEGNNLQTLLFESSLANSFRGDGILKVRWGKRSPNAEKPESIIEEVPPSIYFPETSPDNVREVGKVWLAWTRPGPPAEKDKTYLRVEEHEPGIIRNFLFKMEAGKIVPMDLMIFKEYQDLEEEQETGLDVIPIFHVPNFRIGSAYWGISDYAGIESIFEAINSRLSQIDRVLTKHSDPRLLLPPGLVDEDGKIDVSKLDAIELARDAPEPKYLTWDGQLAAAFQEVEKLTDFVFLASETAPEALGLMKQGGVESGRALRLRLIRTLAKVNRKRLYYDQAIKQALFVAQQFEVNFGNADYTPERPEIKWADGLPEDMMELVQMEAQRLAAGNTSLESSIRRLDGPDAVQAEMERIAEETGQAAALTGGQGQP